MTSATPTLCKPLPAAERLSSAPLPKAVLGVAGKWWRAYALANAGHDTRALQAWLGHKNIQHTVRYTELAPDRFKDFWR